MLNLFPGDRLWGRYRIERAVGEGISGAWLSSIHASAKNPGLAARALLLPLRPPPHDPLAPLAECLSEIGSAIGLNFSPALTGGKRLRQIRPVPDFLHDLPLFGRVEWIGESSPGGMIILPAPKAQPLPELIESQGVLSPAQCIRLLTGLLDDIDKLVALVIGKSQRQPAAARLMRSLARLLFPEGLSLRSDSARLIVQPYIGKSLQTASPPAWSRWLAPELFSDEFATPSSLVFGTAALAGWLTTGQPGGAGVPEIAWKELAEKATGRHDPAREFLKLKAADALPADFRELLARCLSRSRSRRLSSPLKFLDTLLVIAEKSPKPLACGICGFVAGTENPKLCGCCGAPLPQFSVAEGLGAGKSDLLPNRPRRSGTTTLLKAASQSAQALVAVHLLESMAVVPAGSFISGETKSPRTLRAFAVDLLPVTEGQYKKFLAAALKTARPAGPGSLEAARDQQPVTAITWYEANEFAEFYHKRLPTMYEWEKAARGTDGRKFPFGNQFKPSAARLRTNDERSKRAKTPGLSSVGSFPDGASPYGVLDLVGSVLQWTSSARRSGERLFRAIKGSCYLDGSPELARCTSVQYLPPETREAYIGFRCVKDLE